MKAYSQIFHSSKCIYIYFKIRVEDRVYYLEGKVVSKNICFQKEGGGFEIMGMAIIVQQLLGVGTNLFPHSMLCESPQIFQSEADSLFVVVYSLSHQWDQN